MAKPDFPNLRENLPLWILRIVFLLIAGGMAGLISKQTPQAPASSLWLVFGGMILLALLVIGLDMFTKQKRLDVVTAVYFGLIVGLFLTYVGQFAWEPFLDIIEPPPPVRPDKPAFEVIERGLLHKWTPLVVGVVLCYMCISLLLQTRDDFRFIIPYVEFSKEVKGLKPVRARHERGHRRPHRRRGRDQGARQPAHHAALRAHRAASIADSSDRLRRSRGRRGLDILNRLRTNGEVDLEIFDRELPEFAGQTVDQKLVLLAKHLDGKIVTNDYNLNKVARLHGVGVINLNDLANALKPVFLPGEHLKVP